MVTAAYDVPKLLLALDGLVRSDRAPSGLDGTIAIAVRERHRTHWWTVRFAKTAQTECSLAPPPDFDAAMGLEFSDAELLLSNSTAAPRALLSGNMEFLGEFIRRYVSVLSPLQINIGWQS